MPLCPDPEWEASHTSHQFADPSLDALRYGSVRSKDEAEQSTGNS